MEDDIDTHKLALHKRRRALRKELDTLLDRLQEDLTLKPTVTSVFTIRWAVTA